MSQPVISLYGLEGLALIVSFPSGVLYTNQTGGVCCCQPMLEGMLVPLESACDVEPKLAAFFAEHGGNLCDADADALDVILRTPEASYVVTPTFFLEVDRARLRDSMEAWLHVTVMACPDEHLVATITSPAEGHFGMRPLSGRTWSPADQPELGEHASLYPFSGFGRTSAVLTWPNSD